RGGGSVGLGGLVGRVVGSFRCLVPGRTGGVRGRLDRRRSRGRRGGVGQGQEGSFAFSFHFERAISEDIITSSRPWGVTTEPSGARMMREGMPLISNCWARASASLDWAPGIESHFISI